MAGNVHYQGYYRQSVVVALLFYSFVSCIIVATYGDCYFLPFSIWICAEILPMWMECGLSAAVPHWTTTKYVNGCAVQPRHSTEKVAFSVSRTIPYGQWHMSCRIPLQLVPMLVLTSATCAGSFFCHQLAQMLHLHPWKIVLSLHSFSCLEPHSLSTPHWSTHRPFYFHQLSMFLGHDPIKC